MSGFGQFGRPETMVPPEIPPLWRDPASIHSMMARPFGSSPRSPLWKGRFATEEKGVKNYMAHQKIAMELDKKIALVAHDNKKRDLVEWAKYNRDLLAHHKVYATGTTGEILERELGFVVKRLQSGPLGGDAGNSRWLTQRF
jgi:hypothetical protein